MGRNRIQFLTNQGFRADYFEGALFTIFPNPATEEAFIDLKAFENHAVTLSISDISGKNVMTENIKAAIVAPYRLDVSTLQTGLYFVKLQAQGKRMMTQKLQVTK